MRSTRMTLLWLLNCAWFLFSQETWAPMAGGSRIIIASTAVSNHAGWSKGTILTLLLVSTYLPGFWSSIPIRPRALWKVSSIGKSDSRFTLWHFLTYWSFYRGFKAIIHLEVITALQVYLAKVREAISAEVLNHHPTPPITRIYVYPAKYLP